MRNDYDRFCRIASESDSSHFCLVNAYNDKYFGHTFSKMMAKDTFMEEMVTSSTQTPKGVFVDIFPIDYANSSEKRNIDSFKKMRRISRNLLCRGNYYFGQSGIRLLLYRINGVLLRLIPKSFFLEKMDAIVENRDPNPKVLSLSGTYNYEKEIHDTSIFNEYQYIAFEDRKYMAIKQADMFLTDAYGDYMKLPPKEKQIPHHFVVGIDLEQYWRK